MTNKDAIYILSGLKKSLNEYCGLNNNGQKAFDMAISALQEQDSRRICDTCKHNPPSKKWPCVDCDMREPVDRWEPQEVKKSRCTYKPDCPWYDGSKCNSPNDHGYNECDYDRGIFPESYEENVKNSTESSSPQKSLDTISRQAAIDVAENAFVRGLLASPDIRRLPSAQPEWNNHTVACLLAELFDDTCACNYNGIDEWLPSKCELLDSCPNPVGVACWEQYLKHREERRTDGKNGSD